MDLPGLLDILYPWVIKNGFLSHSLAELAQPTGLSRGAFCHYFSAKNGGIKKDMAHQLLEFGRERRRHYLVYPLKIFSGSLLERRNMFARQMSVYLKKNHGSHTITNWMCPAYQLEMECYSFLQMPPDVEYHALLEELWRGPQEYKIVKLNGQHFERLFSGPYPSSVPGVLDFFS